MVSGNVTSCPTRGVDGEGVPIVTDRDSGVGAGVVGVGVGVGVGVTGDGLYDDVQPDAPTSSATSNRRFIASTLPDERDHNLSDDSRTHRAWRTTGQPTRRPTRI